MAVAPPKIVAVMVMMMIFDIFRLHTCLSLVSPDTTHSPPLPGLIWAFTDLPGIITTGCRTDISFQICKDITYFKVWGENASN